MKALLLLVSLTIGTAAVIRTVDLMDQAADVMTQAMATR